MTLGSLSHTYNGTSHPATASTNPAGLAVEFTYNGSPTAPTNVGNYAVVGTVNDANYSGSNSGTLIISKGNPSVTLAVNNSPVTFDGYGHAASVTVVNSSINGYLSNISTGGSNYQYDAGSYPVTANFVPYDTSNYNTLVGVSAGNFFINKANPVVTLAVDGLPVAYDGLPHSAPVIVSSSSVGGTLANILTGGAATQINVGTYAVIADFIPTNTNNYNTLTGLSAGNFMISKGIPVVNLAVTNSPVRYNGSSQPVMITIVSSTVSGTVAAIKYNGSATVPSVMGTYTITADFVPTDTANYYIITGIEAGKYVIQGERLKNGGLNTYVGTAKIPSSWQATNFLTTDGKDTANRKEGSASVKIIGASGKTKTLMQTISMSGAKGDAFALAFWAKGTTIPQTGICKAEVLFYNGTLLTGKQAVNCGTGTYAWKKYTTNFAVPGNYNKVVIKFTYAKSTGTLWLDAVSLIR